MNALRSASVRLLFVAVAAIGASGAVAADPLTSITVMTDKGSVTGGSSPTMNTFLGIPYAAPPVGSLRWKAPQPSAPWLKLRATKFATHCPQLAGSYGQASTTEDCLYLNVYAPNNAGPGKQPVMIYIHGGSNKVGESDDMDRPTWCRTTWSSSLNYLFKYHPSIPNPVPLNATQHLLSQAMIRYWTQFARNGDPNSASTPVWPTYTIATDPRQSLSPPAPYTQTSFAVDHHCAFWAPGT